MDISELQIGDVLINNEIMEVFGVGNSGGMRPSNSTNTLVIVSDPFKGLYEDRWEDSILHYTGMGLLGDQELRSHNKTLAESDINGKTVHFFEVLTPKEYTYRGTVKLAGEPYQEEQPDDSGNIRKVWMFPLMVSVSTPITTKKELEKKYEKKEKRASKSTDKELLERLKNGNKNPSRRLVATTHYERNPDVVEYAKRKANGICALCEEEAPFKNKVGEPCLEVHHIEWLSRGGKDSIENVAALCPNCHRKMHALDNKEEVTKLLDIAKTD